MEKTTDAMKHRGIPRQLRYAVATALVLLALLGLTAGFVVQVYLKTESACYEDLAVSTEDAITNLESNLRSDRTMLRVMAGLIGNNDDINSLEVSGYLTNYDYNSLVTQSGILLPGDRYMFSKARRTIVDTPLSFDKESIQGEHISGYRSENSNSVMIRNCVPIRKDGICIGVLYSAASSSSIAKAWLPNLYEKKGDCFVVNRRTGEIILNTTQEQISDIHDISFIQTDTAYTKSDTITSILDGKKGYSVFRSSTASERFFMCYLPFSIENWEMVVFVPESAVFSAVEPIRKWMYAMIIAGVIIILIYALWLIREIRSSIAEAEMKANTDVLTGLQNRNRYEAYLKKLEGTKEKLVCLFVDANGLHELNNSKGHTAGDQMLRFIADTLKVQFGGEHIYRIGGDEFVVFQSEKSQSEIDDSLAVFNDAMQRNDYHAAVGSCTYDAGMSINQLVGNAEKAMYEAKNAYYQQLGKAMRA